MAHVWRSEDHVQKSVLSPYCVGPGNQTQVARCAGRSFYTESRQKILSVAFEKNTRVHICWFVLTNVTACLHLYVNRGRAIMSQIITRKIILITNC